MSEMRIAFLGTGIMGLQMARRLAEAGHGVTAWNRTRERAAPLAAYGVELAETPVAAVAGAEVAICMLSDGPACDAVLIAQGTLAALPAGSLILVMSSIPVETAQGQAARAADLGLRYVDAPVSGGEPGARDGTLAIMAGGAAADVAAAAAVFEVLGHAAHVGPAGSGQLAKLANQLIVGNTIATVAEALLLAARGGADPAAVRQALMGGFADSPILRRHGQCMLDGDFAPGGKAKIQLKDMRTITALARKLGLELPLAELTEGAFADVVAHGDGELDHSALYRELVRRNGLNPDG